VVVGGGGVGSMFAALLGDAGDRVCVIDRAPRPTPRPGEVFEQGDITAPTRRVLDELRDAELVVLALPEDVALAAVEIVSSAMRPGALLVDTSSVKTAICDAMRTRAAHLEGLGLNPMFAPSLDPAGRPIAAVVVRGGPRTTRLLELLAERGGRIVELTADQHDRLTAAAQALPHAAILAFGAALAELDVDLRELERIAPPPCATLLALLARIVSGPPEVYWQIQIANPGAEAAREGLAASLGGLIAAADRRDGEAFAGLLRAGRRALGERVPAYRERCAAMFGTLVEDRAPSRTWVEARIHDASDALDRAFDEGLTGHTFVERRGKRVRLDDGSEATEFVSCSYLGLEQHPALIAAAADALQRFGAHFSSSRNRMRPPYLAELEQLLGEIYAGAPVVCFTSVSNVHLGVLPLLGSGALPSYPIARGGATFLVERTAHASIQVLRGIMGQIGPVHRFELAKPEGLALQLEGARAAGRTPIVLVDGVGSMGGLIDVAGLRATLEPFGGHLYVDDAHGVSIEGRRGAGYAFEQLGGLPDRVLLAGSLSKAFGGSGAFAVLGAPADVPVLRKLANPLVFGHSIMLPMLAANVAAARLHLDGEVAALQDRLWSNARYFDEITAGRLLNAHLRSPVRGASFATEDAAFAAARSLRTAGVLVLPAFFPTVARGSGLIRFALSSLHDRGQLDAAAAALHGHRA
jgi:7-keto-8-aminopelargonate synthetase-like enzyme/prephenate dehydrogenase